MDKTKQLCSQYMASESAQEKENIKNLLASHFYESSAVHNIVRSACFSHGLHQSRIEDIKQETIIEFIFKNIDKLRDPNKAMGLVKTTARYRALSFQQNLYDIETMKSYPLDSFQNKEYLPPDLIDVQYLNEQDQRDLMGNDMKEKARDAIRKIIEKPSLERKKVMRWMPAFSKKTATSSTISKYDLQLLPKADASSQVEPAYPKNEPIQSDENLIWFNQILLNKTKLSTAHLASLIGANPASFNAYRYYQNRIPADLMKTLEKWYQIYGVYIANWQNDVEKIPMNDLVISWKKRLGIKSDKDLQEILDVGRTTVWRWKQEKNVEDISKDIQFRPGPSRLYELEMIVAQREHNELKTQWLKQTNNTSIAFIVRDWMKRLNFTTPDELSDFFGSHIVSKALARKWMDGDDSPRTRPTPDKLFEFEMMVNIELENREHKQKKSRIFTRS